jgi:hypothetical protein
MKNKQKYMLGKVINGLILLLVFLFIGCNSKEKNFNSDRHIYQAIHNKDTAILSISITKTRFHGQYEIRYDRFGKDSGDVRGDIKGDTFRGDFHYFSFGGGMKRVPLALLRKQNKLYLGKGVIGTYFNLPCFVPDVPIDYNNSNFVFELLPESSK